jgi:hypothetical protein
MISLDMLFCCTVAGSWIALQGRCEYFHVRSGENIPVFDSPAMQSRILPMIAE